MHALEKYQLRLNADDLDLVRHAARLSGVPVGDFIRRAAVREARKVIEQSRTILLTAEESRKIMEALDRPFSPNERMRETLALADRVIQNSRVLNLIATP